MIKGTPISSPIISNNGNPTHYDEFGVGGYREVSTKNDMYNLSSKLLKVGCLVYVQEEDKIYKYKGNSQWEELKFKDDTPVTPPVKAKSYRLSMRAASTNNTVVLTDVEDNTETTANIPVASMTNLGEIKLGYQTNNKNYALQLDENNRAYVNVPWTPGTGSGGGSHITQFTSFAFIRSKTRPSTPSGGTYENPVPNGWSDGIPEGTDPVWFSTRIFNSDNSIAGSWSTPTLLTDSASMDVCYSNSNTRPDAPTTHGTQNDSVWHNDAQPDDIWMAMSTRTSITENWSNWEIFRIKGEKGEDGTSLKVVGTYDNSRCELTIDSSTKNVTGIVESNIKFADSSHTLTVGDCLQVVDSCDPSYNGHIIVLVDNNPKKWQDLGVIQGKAGEDGKSSYVHVKWSNNVIPNAEGINTNENASFTEQDGEVPGIYRGEYVDDNPNDSTDINKYRWVRAKGQDGFSYWFFYTVTNTNKKPTSTSIPTIKSASELQKASLTASDGTIWYDEIPTDTSIYDPETQYLWQIWVRDDQTDLTFKGPILYAAPSSDGVAYNIVVNNEGIYWSSDNNRLTSESTNKNLNIIVYKNESVLDINSSTEYTLEASVQNSDKSTSTSIAINNSVIKFENINPHIKYPQIFIYLKKSGTLVYQYQYNIPLEGKTGPQGAPGTPADTGITILLSNDVAHIPCNPDNSPISIAQVQTDIEVFKGDTNVTNSVALGSDSNTQNSISTSQAGFNYDYSVIRNTVSYSNGKYTLTSKLISTDNNYQYLVPIYIRYNNYVYTKYFTIRKDYTGDVYELIVTPQVYTDEDTDKTLDIKVNRTYSRTGHPTGVITSTDDPEYNNLKIAINDGNKQSLIGYTTTKLDQASFNVKLYEKKPNTQDEYNLIDEEVVTRVVGSQGAQGIQGCILRNRGYWKSDVNDYINQGEYAPASATEIRYIDYVFLKGSSTDSTTSDKCYRVNYASQIHSHINDDTRNGIVKVPAGTTPGSNNEYWVEATSQEFAYIKDLIAQQISAQTITADEFLVKRKLTDNSTQIVAGMVKGDTNTTKTEDNVVFFAGTSATDTSNLNTKEAKTYITEGGTLHSEDADITGNVQASRLIVNANTTNPGKDDKVTPSIIFTTYQDSTEVYSYESDGTPKNPVLMSTFNNLKDSNGNNLTAGSPVGIVYSLNTNNIYVPTYFFDFAPLTVKTGTAISVFSTVEGAAANSASSEFNIYLGSDSIYYSDSNLTAPYNGEFYVKYEMNQLLTTISNNNSNIYLQPYPSYIILEFTMSNGKSGTYNGLYVYCTKYVDSYGNVDSTGVYLTNMFESSTALDVSTFANSAYWYNNSSTTKAWTSIKKYKLATAEDFIEVGTTNIRFYTNVPDFNTEIDNIPSTIKEFYGTSTTPTNLYNSNDATKQVLLFGVKMLPAMDDVSPKLNIYVRYISLNTYNK